MRNPRFYWWHVENLREFAKKLADAPDGHVLTFDGEMLRVRDPKAEAAVDEDDGDNFVFTCPPVCP